MGVTEIKQEIKSYEVSIENQQKSFLSFRQQFVDAIKPFIKERLKKEVENEVKCNSEHTKKLGKTALSEMKAQLTELLKNSDRIVDETFSDDTLWTYVNYKILPDGDRFRQKYNNKKTAEENILKGIKTIIGEAGQILLDNKYITVGNQYRWGTDVWHDYTYTGKDSAKLVYGYGLPLPQNIKKLIDKYCKDIEDLHEVVEKVLDLKKKLSEQEAVDLWDEV